MGFLDEDGLISKTKTMVLSLSSIISSGSSRFPSPMQIQKDQYAASTYNMYLPLSGLKTLIYEQEALQIQSPTHQLNPLIIHSYTIPRSSSFPSSLSSDFQSLSTHSSSYSSWSSGMDDMLGTESGVYMIHNALKVLAMDQKENGYDHGNKRKRGRAMAAGEYPPPIPLLARTGNLPGHMPWILARHYSNGRLILKEEKVKHHEYFEAYRENGRLILNLVSLDDTFRCCHAVCEDNDDDEEEDEDETELENLEFFQGYQELEKVEEHNEETDDGDEEEEEEDEDEDEDKDNGFVNQGSITSAYSVPEFCHGSETYGDPRKCLTYSGRIIKSESSSIFPNASDHQDVEEGNSAPLTFYNIIPRMTTIQLPVM